jgi:hypothetical protein
MGRTAHLIGASAVLVLNDMGLPPSAVLVARQLDVTVINTPMDKYHSCIAVHQLMEQP